MVSQLPKPNAPEVFYPDSDGQPMASNTEQYRWIVTIQQNLDWLLKDAFVAGDLFWYPIEGRSDISVAPDVMVALSRPKGKRLSYKQWLEDNVAPQVVFEILSPSNTRKEMDSKLLFFDRHGVEEYYIYDTERKTLNGFTHDEFGLTPVEDIASGWVSPLLNIRFDMSAGELQLFRPDGVPFSTY
ncbi:MAG: Uma2 family endonuclease [Cyanobacteria bacterium J06627_28]